MNFSSTHRSNSSDSELSISSLSSHHRRRVEVMNRINTRRIIEDSSYTGATSTPTIAGLLQRDENNLLLPRGSASSTTTAPFNLSVTQLEEPSEDTQLRTTYSSIVPKRNNLRGMLTDPYRRTSLTHEINLMNNEQDNENSTQSEILSQKQQAEDLRILHRNIIKNAMKLLDDF